MFYVALRQAQGERWRIEMMVSSVMLSVSKAEVDFGQQPIISFTSVCSGRTEDLSPEL